MLLLRLCALALSTAFAPTRLRAAPTRLAATATEEDVRLRVTLATQTAGRSFSFDVQKQVWLYRRCPARYSVDGSGVEIVAEGAKSKLEPFLKWHGSFAPATKTCALREQNPPWTASCAANSWSTGRPLLSPPADNLRRPLTAFGRSWSR